MNNASYWNNQSKKCGLAFKGTGLTSCLNKLKEGLSKKIKYLSGQFH